MKPCPYCGKPVRFWRLWKASRWTPYRCAECGGRSEVALSSRIICAVVGPLPIMALAVGMANHWDITSWGARLLVAVPMGFAGSFLMGFLLARFGRFVALNKPSVRLF